MVSRPMPTGALVAICTLLVAGASVMAWQAVALAADGAFQLVRVLGTGELHGPDSRILATSARQGAVLVAARAGVTDTHALTILLGAGQLVLPAIAWSLAIVMSRADRLVCATVSMIAGLAAGATWFASVGETVVAVPLTTLVAILLWQQRDWRWRDVVLATLASGMLVATYETAVLTGSVLAVWAAWRAHVATARTERVGCWVVAGLSLFSALVAILGTRAGANPTHSESFLYSLVSLEPWPFYVGLAGIAVAILALGPWLDHSARRLVLAAGCVMLVVAVIGLAPDAATGFQARGGTVLACVLLEAFLWWRWIERRRSRAQRDRASSSNLLLSGRLFVVLPAAFVTAMVAVNVLPVRSWSQSLDSFRAEVNRTQGIRDAVDTLPPDRRDVIWGWTSSSLSLIVREKSTSGVLVDRNPSIVPFAASEARAQLADTYVWQR